MVGTKGMHTKEGLARISKAQLKLAENPAYIEARRQRAKKQRADKNSKFGQQQSYFKSLPRNEVVRILTEKKTQHDRVMQERIAYLQSLGAKIFKTDFALEIKKRRIGDILYKLSNQLIEEDVKGSGRVVTENVWEL